MEKQLGSSKKKKIVWGLIIIVILILSLLFVFKNNIKAVYYGVDVRYFDDPKYCQIDKDCALINPCRDQGAVNIYNYDSSGSCDVVRSKSICENNICVHDGVRIPNE
jgi:hypothetical protein